MVQAKIYVRNIKGNPINVHTARLEENQIILAPRNQEIKNLMRQNYLEGVKTSEIQKLTRRAPGAAPSGGDYIESPNLTREFSKD